MPPVRKADFQNVYTPLSQNTTDSEECSSSEEELHSACNLKIHHHKAGNGSSRSRQQPKKPSSSSSYMNGNSTAATTMANTAAAVVSAPQLSDAVAHHQHILQLNQQYTAVAAASAAAVAAKPSSKMHNDDDVDDDDVDLMMVTNFTQSTTSSFRSPPHNAQQLGHPLSSSARNNGYSSQPPHRRSPTTTTSPTAAAAAMSHNQQQHHHHQLLHLNSTTTTGSSLDGDTASVTILGRSSSSHKLLASPSDSGGGSSAAHHHLHHHRRAAPMGPIRRCLFVASLVLCVLTVVVFVWVVPCESDGGGGGTCPARTERLRTQNWVRRYEGLELKGAINVVRGVRGRSNNLVFMYRGERLMNSINRFGPSSSSPSSPPAHRRNGIIALVGSTGAVSWYDEIGNEPTVIDCGLIDADRNGVHDCLVLDDVGELGCIDPVSGQWLWRIHDRRTMSSARLLSFPLVLPDLNADGVAELLVTTTTSTKSNNNRLNHGGGDDGTTTFNALIIVSGATGRTLGSRYVLRDCTFVHRFQLDPRAVKVTFNCIKPNGTELQIIESLDTLVQRLFTNRTSSSSHPTAFEAQHHHVSHPSSPATKRQQQQQQQQRGGKNSIAPPPIAQHKFFGQRRDRLTQRNIYAVAGKQLIVENTGKCPDACNVTVQLIEHGPDGKEHVIRNFSGSRMYGMVPALLSFNASRKGNAGQKQTVHGFVIKFWQWEDKETDVVMQFGGGGDSENNHNDTMDTAEQQPSETRTKRDTTDDDDDDDAERSPRRTEEFNRFAHVMPPESPRWRYPEVLTPMPVVRLRRSTTSMHAQNDSRTAAENSTGERLAGKPSSSSASSTTTAAPNRPSSSSSHRYRDESYQVTVRSKMRMIRERVVLIVFNSTDTRIENTSQSNIVQFCRRDEDLAAAADSDASSSTTTTASAAAGGSSGGLSCQPDLNYQENSVLIADLDEDGSQELVTYYTTYVNAFGDADAKMEWKLVNYVQLLRLEAELPKLYVVDEPNGGGGDSV